jgi:hypothetical protein
VLAQLVGVFVDKDGSVWTRVDGAHVRCDASKGFAWAKPRVIRGGVANLFASDGILLVVKRESGPCDAGLCVEVIQRSVSGGDQLVADHESDVL